MQRDLVGCSRYSTVTLGVSNFCTFLYFSIGMNFSKKQKSAGDVVP